MQERVDKRDHFSERLDAKDAIANSACWQDPVGICPIARYSHRHSVGSANRDTFLAALKDIKSLTLKRMVAPCQGHLLGCISELVLSR